MGFGGLVFFFVCLFVRLDERMGEWVVLIMNGFLINNILYGKIEKKFLVLLYCCIEIFYYVSIMVIKGWCEVCCFLKVV